MPRSLREIAASERTQKSRSMATIREERLVKHAALLRALPANNFNRAQTCRELGIPYATFKTWCAENIDNFGDRVAELQEDLTETLFGVSVQRATGTHPSQTEDVEQPGKPDDTTRRHLMNALDPRFRRVTHLQVEGSVHHTHQAVLGTMTRADKEKEAARLLDDDSFLKVLGVDRSEILEAEIFPEDA